MKRLVRGQSLPATERCHPIVATRSVSDDEQLNRVAEALAATAAAETTTPCLKRHGSNIPATFVLHKVEETLLRKIERVLPNFRDLGVSSCTPRMKKGLLFRSARPFGDHGELLSILVNELGVRTVLDLRDDNLTAIPEECESRLLVSVLYSPVRITAARNELANKLNESYGVRVFGEQTFQVWRRNIGGSRPDAVYDTRCLNRNYARARVDELCDHVPDLPRQLAEDIVNSNETLPVFEFAMRRELRNLAIINVLDAPAVKRKVIEHLSQSRYLPIVVLAKAADKLQGTNHLAPYYFCKFVISAHELERTYYEMIDNCGLNFATALKLIALTFGPVLFHCTLGKDRTGVLAMLLLHVLGATEQGIIFDYCLTERAGAVFQEYSKKYIVEYSGMPEKFCASEAAVMRLTIDYVKVKYGSIDLYLDSIGFDNNWREYTRRKYLNDENNCA